LQAFKSLANVLKRIKKHAERTAIKFIMRVVQTKRETKERLRREEEIQRQEKLRLAAEEVERKRIEEAEVERKRIKEREVEDKRIAEEAERKRAADEVETKRIAEEAERKRIEEEAEQKRMIEEAEKKRIADEFQAAEEDEKRRLALEASMRLRITLFLRVRVRHQRLLKSVLLLHDALRKPQRPSEELIAELTRRIPDILRVLDRKNHFNSVLHTLASHGNLTGSSILPLRMECLQYKNSRGLSCFLASICSLSIKDIIPVFDKLFQHQNLPEPLPVSSAILELDGSLLKSDLLEISNKEDGTTWKVVLVEVTCACLVYYADDTNTSEKKELPLRGATLTRVAGPQLILTLVTPEYTKSRFLLGTRVGKVKNFRFPDEKSLISWYISISAAIKLPDPGCSKSTRFSKLFVNRNVTSGMILNDEIYRDKKRNSPLHLLASMKLADVDVDRMLQVVSWLIDHGLEGNSTNLDGETPAILAARNENITLLRFLAVKYNLRSAADGNWSRVLGELASTEHRTVIEKIPRELKPPSEPRKFGNFSYITVNFLFQITNLDVNKRAPYLTVSVFNANLEYLEDPYIIPFPATFT